MFLFNKTLCAPILSLKPVLKESIATHNTVRRLIGMHTNRELNAVAINNVMEKTKGKGTIGNAAALARAILLVDARNPSAAIEEVESVLPDIKNEALKHMAVGVRLAARNYLLDVKETALNVSGGTTEAEVSTLRSEVERDYTSLQTLAPNCWLIQLAAAEYQLYLGHSEEAYTKFVEIEKKILSFLKAHTIWSGDEATPQNINFYSLLGFQLQRALNTKAIDPHGSTLVSEIVEAALEEPAFAQNFTEFKKQSGVEMTNEEAFEIIFALYNASIRHHFHEFFTPPFEYNDWQSEPALRAKNVVLQALAHKEEFVSDELLTKMKTIHPPKAFYGCEEELRDVIKGVPKDSNVITEIRHHFGKGPQTPLSGADQAFYDASEALNMSGASRDTAGTVAYAKRQRDVAKVLVQQLLYRVQVQMSVALTELQQLHDAEKIITPVINANEYIYMWRALLARSRIYKGLGLVTPSDRDLKILYTLKRHTSERAPYEMDESTTENREQTLLVKKQKEKIQLFKQKIF